MVRDADQPAVSDHLSFTGWIAGILLRWRTIAAIACGSVLLGMSATVILPPVYQSRASFVANGSAGSALQKAFGSNRGLDGLISQFGGGVGGDPSESPNFYVQLISSRELLTRLLQSRFPNPRTDAPNDSATLLTILRIRKPDARRQLELGVQKMNKSIGLGLDSKTNLVWFSVDAQWGELSAQVANKVVDLVSSFDREIRVSKAKSTRVFLQMRYDSAQAALRGAEATQRYFYEKNRGIIGAPSLRYEEQRIRRDVDMASDLYVTLARQLEVARIDEINDAALITVIDSAVVPRKALWPRYWVMLFSASSLGLLAGLIGAGSATVLAHWRARNPESWGYLRNAVTRAGSQVVGVTSARSTGRLADEPDVRVVDAATSQGGRQEELIANAQRRGA